MWLSWRLRGACPGASTPWVQPSLVEVPRPQHRCGTGGTQRNTAGRVKAVVAVVCEGHRKQEDAANKAPGARWGTLNWREGSERLSDSSRVLEGQPHTAHGPGNQRPGGCLCLQARRRNAALRRKVSDGDAKATSVQCPVPARTLGDIEKALSEAAVSLEALGPPDASVSPPKGIALPLKGAAPGQREARGCAGPWGSRSSIRSCWQPLGRRSHPAGERGCLRTGFPLCSEDGRQL